MKGYQIYTACPP